MNKFAVFCHTVLYGIICCYPVLLCPEGSASARVKKLTRALGYEILFTGLRLADQLNVAGQHSCDLRALRGIVRRDTVVAHAVENAVLDRPQHGALRVIADVLRVGEAAPQAPSSAG